MFKIGGRVETYDDNGHFRISKWLQLLIQWIVNSWLEMGHNTVSPLSIVMNIHLPDTKIANPERTVVSINGHSWSSKKRKVYTVYKLEKTCEIPMCPAVLLLRYMQEPPPTKVSAPSRAQRWQWQVRGGGQFGVSLICGVVRAVSTVLVGKQLLYLREDPPVQVSCISFLQLGRHHRNGTCVPDSSHSTVHLSIQWPCFGIHPQLSDTLKYQVC